MNPLETLEARLRSKNLSEVARRAGMAYDNVHRIARGKQEDIYIRTYTKLVAVLDEMEAQAEKSEAE